MKVSGLTHFKAYVHDEIKQAKHWTKRIKTITMYKDNKPMTLGQFKKRK